MATKKPRLIVDKSPVMKPMKSMPQIKPFKPKPLPKLKQAPTKKK